MDVSSLKDKGPALIIFALAIIGRIVLESLPNNEGADTTWITTFAVVAAGWIGTQTGIDAVKKAQGDTAARLEAVERNTNGKSDAERFEIARAAAQHAVIEVETRRQAGVRTVELGAPVRAEPVAPYAPAKDWRENGGGATA